MPRISRLRFGNHDQCRAQDAIGDQVALLQHRNHGIGFLFRINHADRLMAVGIEFFAGRVHLSQGIFLEGGYQLLERQFDAGLEAVHGLFRHGQCSLEAVLDGQEFAGESLDGELVGLGYVFLGAAADVFALRLGAQPGVMMFGSLQFQLAELFFEAGQSVGMLAGSRLGDRFAGRFASEQGFLGIFRVGLARFCKKVVR